jgi:hypothetical protein
MEPEDQWCELSMWRTVGVETRVEFLGVISCFAFIVIPLLYDFPSVWTNLHIALYVVMCYLGAGTVVYHAIPNMYVDGQAIVYMTDYIPMIITCAYLSSIYLWHFANIAIKMPTWAKFAIFSTMMSWFLFLITTMNLISVAIHNAVMVAPPVLIFTAYSYFQLRKRSLTTWAMLVASLVLWLINKHLCASQYWLAIFHAIYHILIAYALWSAGIMGIFVVQ